MNPSLEFQSYLCKVLLGGRVVFSSFYFATSCQEAETFAREQGRRLKIAEQGVGEISVVIES